MSKVKYSILWVSTVILCLVFQIAFADFFVPTSIIAIEKNDLPRDSAIDIAIETAISTFAVDEEEIRNTTTNSYLVQADIDGQIKHVWMVRLAGGFFSPIYVNILSPTGQILDASNTVSLREATESWVREKGQDYFWSIEDKELFFSMYSGMDIGYIISLPSEEDISQDSALAFAKEYVAQNTKLDINTINGFPVSSTFWKTTDVSSANHWSFVFHDKNSLDRGEESRLYQIDIHSQDGSVLQFHNIVEDGIGNG